METLIENLDFKRLNDKTEQQMNESNVMEQIITERFAKSETSDLLQYDSG
jgi:hypothetical protein